MYYSNEERRDLVFLRIEEGLSFRKVALRFHQMHPTRPVPSHVGIAKLFRKFRQTGSVFNRPKPGRPRSETSENKEVMVLASVDMKIQQSLREVSMETGTSLTSVWRILKRHKFHPYGMFLTQELKEADFDLRSDFCEAMEIRLRDPDFLKKVCFSDEATFHLSGYVNTHNCRYWATENPRVFREEHTQYPEKRNVWAGILGNEIIGPFFIDGNLTGPKYMELLINYIVPAMHRSAANQNIPWREVYFQQDGAPPHFSLDVRHYLDTVFHNRWIGRRGPMLWPARSPDLTPLDFFFWGYLKDKVFRTKPENIDEMCDRIMEFSQLPDADMLQRVRESFEERIFVCLNEGGKQFEHLL